MDALVGALFAVVLVITWWVWYSVWSQTWVSLESVLTAETQTTPKAQSAFRRSAYESLTLTAFAVLITVAAAGAAAWLWWGMPYVDGVNRMASEGLYRAGVHDRWRSDCRYLFFDLFEGRTMTKNTGGALYASGVPYSPLWCDSLQPGMTDIPVELSSDPYSQGMSEGYGAFDAVAKQAPILCLGNDCLDIQSALDELASADRSSNQ